MNWLSLIHDWFKEREIVWQVGMAPGNAQFEVEVKFLIADRDDFRRRLLAAGARLTAPRVFERNIRFDTADNALLQRQELLRLRQDTAVKVTFKGQPLDSTQTEAKAREELEMEVTDFDTAVQIFQRLGFAPVQIYEKYRETFQWQDVEVVLDEMPYGDFIELEGDESAIKAAARRFNLDWNRRILANYLGLLAQLKAYHNLPFNDLTFENFRNLSVSIRDIIE